MSARDVLCKLKYANFRGARPRQWFEVRRTHRRAFGCPVNLVVVWLQEPFADWALVAPDARVSEEQLMAWRALEREWAVWCVWQRRFFWSKRTVEKLFKR